MDSVTLIVPYYNQPLMLAKQLALWESYPQEISIIVVDDGSRITAQSVIETERRSLPFLRLFVIHDDIPWNRGGARNLGTRFVETQWLVHIDIDHTLSPDCAAALLRETVNEKFWYLFPRFRDGAADQTRRKDAIADNVTYGPVKPHGDSYLCTRALFDAVGGYDEDYSGCLGGGSPFLRQMQKRSPVRLLSTATHLRVVTRHVVADASDVSLSRDTQEYTRRRMNKEAHGNTHARNPLRFKWSRVL